MISKEQAVLAWIGQTFYHATANNADGTPLRIRKNGKTKVWKTRPHEFKMPYKYGMYDHGYVTHKKTQENGMSKNQTPLEPEDSESMFSKEGLEILLILLFFFGLLLLAC